MKERKVSRVFAIIFASLALAVFLFNAILYLPSPYLRAHDADALSDILYLVVGVVFLLGTLKRRFEKLIPIGVLLWAVAFMSQAAHRHSGDSPAAFIVPGLLLILIGSVGLIAVTRGFRGIFRAIYSLIGVLLLFFGAVNCGSGYTSFRIVVDGHYAGFIIPAAVRLAATACFSVSLLIWAWSRRGKKLFMSPTDKLVALKEQADAGEITAEEYAAKKAEILSQL